MNMCDIVPHCGIALVVGRQQGPQVAPSRVSEVERRILSRKLATISPSDNLGTYPRLWRYSSILAGTGDGTPAHEFVRCRSGGHDDNVGKNYA